MYPDGRNLLSGDDFKVICKNVHGMCVPLSSVSDIRKATWHNFFPAVTNDDEEVYVYKVSLTEERYKRVDYSHLRQFFTGIHKKFPAERRPENNYFEYQDDALGTVPFAYWTDLFVLERTREVSFRRKRLQEYKQQETCPRVQEMQLLGDQPEIASAIVDAANFKDSNEAFFF